MIAVDVEVAECMYEITDLEGANVGYEMGEQGVAADIKWYAEECVGGALIELAVERFAVFDLELE